jgi:hypothetical protein
MAIDNIGFKIAQSVFNLTRGWHKLARLIIYVDLGGLD